MYLFTMSKAMWAICLSCVCHSVLAAFQPNASFAEQSGVRPKHRAYVEDSAIAVCEEFRGVEGTTGSGWLLEDCINVWRSWGTSLKGVEASKKEDRQFFFGISDILRQRGTPCYVEPVDLLDGIGSRSMRLLAAWVYAEEMGCNYLLPKANRGMSGAQIGDTVYCHRSTYMKKDESARCVAFDWVGYFNLSDQITPLPDDRGETNHIKAQRLSNLKTETERFVANGGFDDPPWIHWILAPEGAVSEYYTRLGTWNARKLEKLRNLLYRMRRSFRWRSHPRYAGGQGCDFASPATNIAIHVRLGDRNGRQSSKSSKSNAPVTHEAYFDMLEDFMDRVSAAAIRQGQALPVFHVFSETAKPCPSTETGAFEEFLRWPVETSQIEPCLTAVIPDECWEKTQGAPGCNPARSGTFIVQDKPLHLHVGLDVENALSCMIEADGLLMGCSTFGHLAGLYSEGVKFFSVGCEGWVTPPHYQMVPPMAIADLGSSWVPVLGSWRNPTIYSERILDVALSQLYAK